MSNSLQSLGIDRLSVNERLELIDLIWDSIPEPERIEIPEWHIQELERRLAEADANPDVGVSWEELRARLMQQP